MPEQLEGITGLTTTVPPALSVEEDQVTMLVPDQTPGPSPQALKDQQQARQLAALHAYCATVHLQTDDRRSSDLPYGRLSLCKPVKGFNRRRASLGRQMLAGAPSIQ
jgi:hypothetical protein